MNKTCVNKYLFFIMFTAFNWQFSAHAQALTDPTRPYSHVNRVKSSGTNDADANRLVLTSTIISSNRRVATINGQLVRLGDSIRGARVLTIEASYVELEKNGQTVVLKLLPVSVKKSTYGTDR